MDMVTLNKRDLFTLNKLEMVTLNKIKEQIQASKIDRINFGCFNFRMNSIGDCDHSIVSCVSVLQGVDGEFFRRTSLRFNCQVTDDTGEPMTYQSVYDDVMEFISENTLLQHFEEFD